MVGVGLGELHVVSDDLRAGPCEVANHLRVELAPERGPPDIHLIERLVIDRHEDDIRRRLLLTADAEPLVHGRVLKALQGMRLVEREHSAYDHHGRRDEEQRAQASGAPVHAAPISRATSHRESTWKDWSTDDAIPTSKPSTCLTRLR
jgi:hypothetical protein